MRTIRELIKNSFVFTPRSKELGRLSPANFTPKSPRTNDSIEYGNAAAELYQNEDVNYDYDATEPYDWFETNEIQQADEDRCLLNKYMDLKWILYS